MQFLFLYKPARKQNTMHLDSHRIKINTEILLSTTQKDCFCPGGAGGRQWSCRDLHKLSLFAFALFSLTD